MSFVVKDRFSGDVVNAKQYAEFLACKVAPQSAGKCWRIEI
jgi:hypothetical protein